MLNVDRVSSLVEGPYKGLEVFTEKESEFLFGRNEERERLVYSLQSSRLTVLYGAKQVGKTSLLRAGVANALVWNEVDRSASGGLESSASGAPESAVVVFDDWSNANVLHSLCTAPPDWPRIIRGSRTSYRCFPSAWAESKYKTSRSTRAE
jgi:Novel STAND NTPase 1